MQPIPMVKVAALASWILFVASSGPEQSKRNQSGAEKEEKRGGCPDESGRNDCSGNGCGSVS